MEFQRKIGFEIGKTSNHIRRHMDKSIEIQSLDKITGSNGFIIGYIARNSKRDIYQKDIEEEFSLTRSTVSKVLKLMEEKGLIRRESVPNDARLKKLTLTQKALDIHYKIVETHEALEAKMTRGFSPEEIQALLGMLDRINSNLED